MRKTFGDIIFWSHVVLGTSWVGLLFVPPNIWPNKISFYFFLTLGVVLHQAVWGALVIPWAKRYELVCMLTTLERVVRGERLAERTKQTSIRIADRMLEKLGRGSRQRGVHITTILFLFL